MREHHLPTRSFLDSFYSASSREVPLTINKRVLVHAYFVRQFEALRVSEGISCAELQESLDQEQNASSVF